MTKQEARYHIFVNGEEKQHTSDRDSAEALGASFPRDADVVIIKTIPHQEILVDAIPSCNFCDLPGEYDFKTVMGPWANGCEKHWMLYRTSAKLGTGIGQKWIQKP